MNWYAAHLVLYVQLKKVRQEHFPIWENIVLIKADSEEEAFARAEQRGREDEGDCDGSFRWGGQVATWVFAGVRKLVLCQDADERPGDGTEITYSEMELDSRESVAKFVQGQPVAVRYRDQVRSTKQHKKPKRNNALAGRKGTDALQGEVMKQR